MAQQPNMGLGRLNFEVPRSQTIKPTPTPTHPHTHTALGRTSLNDWSAHRTGRYLHDTKQKHEKNICALTGFEPAITAVSLLRAYALDHGATGIGS
jgi:hypothetical protein